jgi:hypothetical protein
MISQRVSAHSGDDPSRWGALEAPASRLRRRPQLDGPSLLPQAESRERTRATALFNKGVTATTRTLTDNARRAKRLLAGS